MPDGRKLRHREHPFFTEMPPQALLTRIQGLRFSLDEEERITLADALDRARSALDTKSEHNLFVNHPKYAEQGDKLAMAMASGGIDDFHRFVLFHRRLARWGVKRLVRQFDIDEDDAEQFGMLGLLAAARHFKHEKGFQFSTYATTAIHQRCQRHGPEQAMLIRVPSLAYWPLHRYLRTAQRLDARSGTWVGEQFVDWLTRRSPLVGLRIRQFRRAVGIRSLSDPGEPECLLARKLPSDEGLPDAGMMLLDTQSVVRQCVDQLEERDAEILKRRYGFNSTPETLESIARSVDLTKERVRQIILKAESTLRPLLEQKLGLDATPEARSDEANMTGADNPDELKLGDAATVEVLAAIQRAKDIGAVCLKHPLECLPMLVVELVLIRQRDLHEEVVADQVGLLKRETRRVETLENLIGILSGDRDDDEREAVSHRGQQSPDSPLRCTTVQGRTPTAAQTDRTTHCEGLWRLRRSSRSFAPSEAERPPERPPRNPASGPAS